MRYQYQCKKCSSEFEISASMSDIILMTVYCPNCNSNEVNKKFSSPEIIYKSSGFYSTDNKKE